MPEKCSSVLDAASIGGFTCTAGGGWARYVPKRDSLWTKLSHVNLTMTRWLVDWLKMKRLPQIEKEEEDEQSVHTQKPVVVVVDTSFVEASAEHLIALTQRPDVAAVLVPHTVLSELDALGSGDMEHAPIDNDSLSSIRDASQTAAHRSALISTLLRDNNNRSPSSSSSVPWKKKERQRQQQARCLWRRKEKKPGHPQQQPSSWH